MDKHYLNNPDSPADYFIKEGTSPSSNSFQQLFPGETIMTLLSLTGFTIDVLGKVLIGLSVYFVHGRVRKEGKINKQVLGAMQRERNLALAGLILMVLGYFLQLPGKV